MKGGEVVRSNQGGEARQYSENGQIVTQAAMAPFMVGTQNMRPDNASDLEMWWHVHPDVNVNTLSSVQLGNSTPSDADLSVQRGLEADGNQGNTFVIGTRTNDVTYYNGNGSIITVNYDDWRNAGINATVNHIINNILPLLFTNLP